MPKQFVYLQKKLIKYKQNGRKRRNKIDICCIVSIEH